MVNEFKNGDRYKIYRSDNTLSIFVNHEAVTESNDSSGLDGIILLSYRESELTNIEIGLGNKAYIQPSSALFKTSDNENIDDDSIIEWSKNMEELVKTFTDQKVKSDWMFPVNKPNPQSPEDRKKLAVKNILKEQEMGWFIDQSQGKTTEKPVSIWEGESEIQALTRHWRKTAESRWDKMNLNPDGRYIEGTPAFNEEHVYRFITKAEKEVLRWFVGTLMENNEAIRLKRINRLKTLLHTIHLPNRKKSYTPHLTEALKECCQGITITDPKPPLKNEVRVRFREKLESTMDNAQANDAFKDTIKSCGFEWLPSV